MIVVADTSPLNYLILIEEVEILAKIYGRVIVPHSVRGELLSPSAPESVRRWIDRSPAWLEIQSPTIPPDPSLLSLDPGERDAITLATQVGVDLLIIDDRQGRQEAQKRGLEVIGTLGVLREAAILGLLDLRAAVMRLESTSFHIAPEVLARLLGDQS